MLVALLAAPSSALTWEQVLADGSSAAAAKASSSSSTAAVVPAHSSSSAVPAVSLALANFWATLTWNDATAQWDCAPSAQPGTVGTARCTVYPAMIALVISCPDGKQAIAPSCFHPYIGDSPSTVYGWFVRDDKTACGFTNPPEQAQPFVIGGSGYCMTVADVVPAKKSNKGAKKHGR